MNDPVFSIKQNDLWPAIRAILRDSDGNAIDLTGSTVTFTMRVYGSATPPVISAAAATVLSPATAGRVEYQWAGADTATLGMYQAEFGLDIGGKVGTAPNATHLLVRINPHA